jgi:hypothetical protein
MAKEINGMTLEELVAGEKAATIVRRAYEDKMVMYRGVDYNDMRDNERGEYLELSQKLAQVNAVRLKIINEMETRLLDIE